MRVAFVSLSGADRRDTPGNWRVRRVAEGLAAADHEVAVFCAQWWEGETVSVFDRADVTYHALTDTPGPLSFASRLPFALRSFSPDVVHATPDPPSQVAAARFFSLFGRRPLVVEWYGDEDPPTSWGERYTTRAPTTVVTPSRMVSTWVREAGAAEEAVEIIPEGIDVELTAETEPHSDVDIVTCRQMDGNANVESLLLALAELRDRDWHAVVIGDGPARASAKEQAADLRIADRVTFTGELPPAERVAYYKGAHVFAHTAKRTPFATELLWGLACGCVGVVEYHANSAAHELVEGLERGFRATSPPEIASAIEKAGRLDHRTTDDRFFTYSQETMLERYLDCYRDVRGTYGLF
ncbi:MULTISPECIES: glycosyltransferase family 4 protein [unclassified Haladaptatus]|uniref:glycosyltransferase family 4 protein n=1 Tax=unclassified Haladaptatus TaxID=2622732 RepID=UPI0023E84FDC|nr:MULTISPECIES: glycosyltransferase [unclassified Haladaptatus]